ncbi:hypothetical protein NIES2100_41920 [Calothrix sp. NIES-2100]|uniref:hypothetical protein n=1 Tax=Calothrix sp. NIES-2100 TaxID=1954172 RepID=UPI000B611067|nr:hypothetical protein NIES2100_41920 [Calothrix sp. NIES-2100]
MNKSVETIFIGFFTVCSTAAMVIFSNFSIAVAETPIGSENECDFNCLQNTQQASILCRRYENALRSNPNNYSLRTGYRRCQLAFYRYGLCTNTIGMRIGAEQRYIDPRVCFIHLSEFYQKEVTFLR